MNEEKDMRMLIEEDLRHSQEIWESYSHDKEKLGELFQLLLQHYDGEIDGFDEDLWVIQDPGRLCRYGGSLPEEYPASYGTAGGLSG